MNPETTPYDLLGGEEAVRRLVELFYDHMDSLPETYQIRALHPKDLTTSKEKLFKFLSGWLGGPQLYVNEYGHPRLRMRHMPFPIDAEARDQWLLCMRKAMDDMQINGALRQHLEQAFFRTADFMRNRDLPGMR